MPSLLFHARVVKDDCFLLTNRLWLYVWGKLKPVLLLKQRTNRQSIFSTQLILFQHFVSLCISNYTKGKGCLCALIHFIVLFAQKMWISIRKHTHTRTVEAWKLVSYSELTSQICSNSQKGRWVACFILTSIWSCHINRRTQQQPTNKQTNNQCFFTLCSHLSLRWSRLSDASIFYKVSILQFWFVAHFGVCKVCLSVMTQNWFRVA